MAHFSQDGGGRARAREHEQKQTAGKVRSDVRNCAFSQCEVDMREASLYLNQKTAIFLLFPLQIGLCIDFLSRCFQNYVGDGSKLSDFRALVENILFFKALVRSHLSARLCIPQMFSGRP